MENNIFLLPKSLSPAIIFLSSLPKIVLCQKRLDWYLLSYKKKSSMLVVAVYVGHAAAAADEPGAEGIFWSATLRSCALLMTYIEGAPFRSVWK